MAGIPISGIIGGPLSGAIMHGMAGINGWSGWQWMFLLEAIPTFLLGFAFLKWIPNGPRQAKWLNDYEVSLIESGVNHGSKESHSLIKTFKNPKIWKLACLYFCQVMGIYGFTFWLPSLIKEAGITHVRDIGFVTAIPYICAVISIYLITRHSDKHNERYWHQTFSVFLAVTGLLSFMWAKSAGNTNLAVAALSLTACGVTVLGPLFWPISNRFYSGVGAAGAIGAIGAFANVAGFVAPYFIGLTKDLTGTTNYGLLVVATAIITGTICLHKTKEWKAVR
jgi:sugar phosphate permease